MCTLFRRGCCFAPLPNSLQGEVVLCTSNCPLRRCDSKSAVFSQGCRLGDRCKFEHKASSEREDEVERRAQGVSNKPLQFKRTLAPGEQLHIRVSPLLHLY